MEDERTWKAQIEENREKGATPIALVGDFEGPCQKP